ncbi:MAG TPA: hypothetical protein VN886_06125 [Acidimicrobiales bacterium]|nr:hypothetical protein [Acidimicrobiales bacterium]
MNTTEADTVLEILSGYWPTPALTDEEVKAWYNELCRSYLKITTEEAGKIIAASARSGETFRLRPGQIVAEVQALRRRRALDCPPALPSPDEFMTGPELAAAIGELRQQLGWVKGSAPS